jgi:hypothetical protein
MDGPALYSSAVLSYSFLITTPGCTAPFGLNPWIIQDSLTLTLQHLRHSSLFKTSTHRLSVSDSPIPQSLLRYRRYSTTYQLFAAPFGLPALPKNPKNLWPWPPC